MQKEYTVEELEAMLEKRKEVEIKRGIEILNEEELKTHPYEIGKNYLIRTVTVFQVGRLVKVYDNELVITEASWVADTGCFSDSLKDGLESSTTSEIEPFNSDVIINRGAIVDVCVYNHSLPTTAK